MNWRSKHEKKLNSKYQKIAMNSGINTRQKYIQRPSPLETKHTSEWKSTKTPGIGTPFTCKMIILSLITKYSWKPQHHREYIMALRVSRINWTTRSNAARHQNGKQAAQVSYTPDRRGLQMRRAGNDGPPPPCTNLFTSPPNQTPNTNKITPGQTHTQKKIIISTFLNIAFLFGTLRVLFSLY